MGLGGTRSNRTTYYCNIKSKKDNKPHGYFAVEKYEDGEYKDAGEHYAISGYASRIYDTEFEYEGKPIKTIVLVLVEGDEEFHCKANISSFAGRSMANTILAMKEPGYIELRMRTKDDKASLGIFNDNDKTDWKYSWEQQKEHITHVPDPTDESDNPKMIGNYKELNKMLLQEWKDYAHNFNDYCKENNEPKFGETSSSATPDETGLPDTDVQKEAKGKKPDPQKKASKKEEETPPPPDKEPEWMGDLGEEDDLPF